MKAADTNTMPASAITTTPSLGSDQREKPSPEVKAKSSPPQVGGRPRRAPGRSLVLAQSWVPVSVARTPRADVRRSALRAAQAFSLLSSELAAQRGGAKSTTD